MMADGAARVDKLIELDSLRGFMALWVYGTHVLFLAGAPDRGLMGIVGNGGPAVSIFMILSGFAIGTSLLNGRSTYGEYMARRFFRIFPIYAVGLLLGLMTSHLYPGLLQSLGWADPGDVARIAERTEGEASHFWPHFFAHATMVHGAIPDAWLYGSSLAFNSPAWSLSLEAQFYVFAPLMLAILANPAARPIAFAVLVGLALFGPALFGQDFRQVPSFLPLTLTWFIFGLLTAIHLPRLSHRPEILLVAGALIMLLAARSGQISSTLPALVWVAVITTCAVPGWPLLAAARRFMAWRPFVAMGECSYGFYILHLPILIAWAMVLQRQGFAQEKPLFIGALLLTLPVTLAISLVSWHWFEAPINNWARARFRGARTRPVELAS